MTTPSSADSLAVGPISRVPYDVLIEIFVHCLPHHRLRIQQPNTTIAPMLLCQICSAWRTVALNLPILWSHLAYSLTVAEDSDDHHDWRVLKNRFVFLAWWKQKRGSRTPYLAIYIRQRTDDISKYQEPKLDAVEMTSLLEYIASARYLEIDNVFWSMLDKWNLSGYPKIYPTHHTLVKSGCENDSDCFYPSQALIADHAPSTLRHLSISHDTLPHGFLIPNHWSKLTRIALDDVVISLDVWFSFLRAVPDLQWGYFNIIALSGEHVHPSKYTHSQLSMAFVTLSGIIDSFKFPLSTLFTNLHLPALHTLSVCTHDEYWYDYRHITELGIMLNSTPAIKTLILEDSFLCIDGSWPEIQYKEPFWRHTPHLVYLKLRWNDPELVTQKIRDSIIRNVFRFDNQWLGLGNPACPIQKITLVDSFVPSDSESESINNVTMSRIQGYLGIMPSVNVVFDISSILEDYGITAAGEYTFTIAGDWNEWGPNLESK